MRFALQSCCQRCMRTGWKSQLLLPQHTSVGCVPCPQLWVGSWQEGFWYLRYLTMVLLRHCCLQHFLPGCLRHTLSYTAEVLSWMTCSIWTPTPDWQHDHLERGYPCCQRALQTWLLQFVLMLLQCPHLRRCFICLCSYDCCILCNACWVSSCPALVSVICNDACFGARPV